MSTIVDLLNKVGNLKAPPCAMGEALQLDLECKIGLSVREGLPDDLPPKMKLFVQQIERMCRIPAHKLLPVTITPAYRSLTPPQKLDYHIHCWLMWGKDEDMLYVLKRATGEIAEEFMGNPGEVIKHTAQWADQNLCQNCPAWAAARAKLQRQNGGIKP